MKKLTAILSMVAGIAATSAFAGGPGPVIIEDAPIILEEAATTSGPSFGSLGGAGVLGAVALVALIAALASDNDDGPSTTPNS